MGPPFLTPCLLGCTLPLPLGILDAAPHFAGVLCQHVLREG